MMKIIINIKEKYIPKFLIKFKIMYHNRLMNKKIKNINLKFLTTAQIKEAKKFWKKYTKHYNVKFLHYYSSIRKEFNKYYIPDNLYYSYIETFFNNHKMAYGIDNKGLYEKILPNVKQPNTVIRKMNGNYYDNNYNLINFNDVIKLFQNDKNYILKPIIDTTGGRGIKIVSKNDFSVNSIIDMDNLIF